MAGWLPFLCHYTMDHNWISLRFLILPWSSWADDVDSNKFGEGILINKRPSFVGLQFKWALTLSEDDCLPIYLNMHLITEYSGCWQPPDRGAEDSSRVRHHCLFVWLQTTRPTRFGPALPSTALYALPLLSVLFVRCVSKVKCKRMTTYSIHQEEEDSGRFGYLFSPHYAGRLK